MDGVSATAVRDGDPRPALPDGSVRASQRRAARWPYAELDVAAVRAGGRAPVPFREVVLKVHQRCNLACDYCYVYEHADQSWRGRPAVDVRARCVAATAAPDRRARPPARAGQRAGRAARRRAAAVRRRPARPALAGDGSRRAAGRLPGRAADADQRRTLLDEPAVAMLVTHGIRAGVSVDGVRADHDRHRRTPNGRGSFAAVDRALRLLRRPENRAAYAGCSAPSPPTPTRSPATSSCWPSRRPRSTCCCPTPTGTTRRWRPAGAAATPYADWLIAVFDRWYAEPSPTRIRLFEDAIGLVLGGAGRTEQLGLSPSGVVVVESDGASSRSTR